MNYQELEYWLFAGSGLLGLALGVLIVLGMIFIMYYCGYWFFKKGKKIKKSNSKRVLYGLAAFFIWFLASLTLIGFIMQALALFGIIEPVENGS